MFRIQYYSVQVLGGESKSRVQDMSAGLFGSVAEE